MIRDHIVCHLRAAHLRTVAVHVLLWQVSDLAENGHNYDGDNIWRAVCLFLRILREHPGAPGDNVHTITVKVNALGSESEAQFLQQIDMHEAWRQELEDELLEWAKRGSFRQVVVEFMDVSKVFDVDYAATRGARLLFPRLALQGVLRCQDYQIIQERWVSGRSFGDERYVYCDGSIIKLGNRGHAAAMIPSDSSQYLPCIYT